MDDEQAAHYRRMPLARRRHDFLLMGGTTQAQFAIAAGIHVAAR